MRFNELNLSPELLRAIEDCGYSEATYIQKACIPVVLNGGDVIGQSQTGTGKTAAFAIPIIELTESSPKKRPQALIMSPTRELALQVTDEIRKFTKYKESIRTVCIYGGQPIQRQIQDLKKGADIVVGTPGRILDHINRKTLRFNECKMLVLDEADEMLNMGFREDIETVLKQLPTERQTVLFSATMPKDILDIAQTYQENPIHIKNPTQTMTSKTIDQQYMECNQSDKRLVLMQLMQHINPNLSMIFCNTKKMVDDLVTELNSNGFSATGLHGDIKQEMRTNIMNSFKSRKISTLVATDVAARGIDVDSMDVVFNFDFPQEIEYYVHRIGRTGRAGKEGLAITLITPRQRNKIRDLERITKSKLTKRELLSKEELKQSRVEQVKRQLIDSLNKPAPKEVHHVLQDITKEGFSWEDIACALAVKSIGSNLFSEVNRPQKSDRTKTNSTNKTALLLDVGKRQGISAAHVVSAIAEASGMSGRDIGKIQISERDTTVDIPTDLIDLVIESVNKTTINGFVVKCIVAGQSSSKRDGKRRKSSNSEKPSDDKKRRNKKEKKPRKSKS